MAVDGSKSLSGKKKYHRASCFWILFVNLQGEATFITKILECANFTIATLFYIYFNACMWKMRVLLSLLLWLHNYAKLGSETSTHPGTPKGAPNKLLLWPIGHLLGWTSCWDKKLRITFFSSPPFQHSLLRVQLSEFKISWSGGRSVITHSLPIRQGSHDLWVQLCSAR